MLRHCSGQCTATGKEIGTSPSSLPVGPRGMGNLTELRDPRNACAYIYTRTHTACRERAVCGVGVAHCGKARLQVLGSKSSQWPGQSRSMWNSRPRMLALPHCRRHLAGTSSVKGPVDLRLPVAVGTSWELLPKEVPPPIPHTHTVALVWSKLPGRTLARLCDSIANDVTWHPVYPTALCSFPGARVPTAPERKHFPYGVALIKTVV